MFQIANALPSPVRRNYDGCRRSVHDRNDPFVQDRGIIREVAS